MDAFKRFFNNMNPDDNKDSKEKNRRDRFKKNIDEEFDSFFEDSHGNNLKFFGFPKDVLDQFEQIMSSLGELDEFDDKSEVPDIFKEDFFKNSDAFKHYNDFKSSRQSDNDLDGKIYADQLDALLKRVSPDFRGILPQEIPRTPKRKLRLTDDQKIMDMIHGTYKEEVFTPRPRPKKIPQRKTPSFNFDGTPIPTPPTASSRTWRTVISIRKPDGSYETRKTERNTDGSVVTTITKTEKDGRRVSETFNSDSNSKSSMMEKPNLGGENEEYDPEKNFRVCDGYKVPVLW